MRKNVVGFGIAGLILGILSIMAGFSPFLWIVGLILGIVGLILSIKQRKINPNGMAIAGLVLSIIGIVLSGIIFIIYSLLSVFLFAVQSEHLSSDLSDCQGKGGICVMNSEKCPTYTLHSSAFSCLNSEKCCLGSPKECTENSGCSGGGTCKNGLCYS